MTTIRKTGELGRDNHGKWRPGLMTHAELVEELKTATGDRRAELVGEAMSRMKGSNYPPFPENLGLPSPE